MSKKDLTILVVLFGASFVYRIFVVFSISYTFYSDDAVYATLAMWFGEGKFLQAFHPFWTPLFPFLVSSAHTLFDHWETAGRMVPALAGSLIAIPIFFLTKKTISTSAAIFLSIAASFVFPIFELSLVALSDVLSALLIISSMVVIFYGIADTVQYTSVLNKRTRKLLLGSFLTGLLYLTRPEGLLFFIIFLSFVSIHVLFQISRNRFHLIDIWLIPLFISVFLVTISPYVVATKMQLGFWTLSSKSSAQFQQGHAFALRENGETWAQEVWSVNPNYFSSYFQGGGEYVMKNIDYFLMKFSQNQFSWRNILLSYFPLWSILIMATGILSGLMSRHRISFLFIFFVILIAVPVTIFSTALADIRYLLWTLPLLLYFFYFGTNVIVASLIKKSRFIAPAVALFLIVSLPVFQFDMFLNPPKFEKYFKNKYFNPDVVKISQWIKEDNKEKPRVMTRHEAIAWYTGGETVYLPQGNLSEVISYAKDKDVDYLVLRDDEVSMEKELAVLLSGKVGDGLSKVYELKSSKHNFVIYTLK